jgi:hypothetical protein
MSHLDHVESPEALQAFGTRCGRIWHQIHECQSCLFPITL